jgi:hypothetical protein
MTVKKTTPTQRRKQTDLFTVGAHTADCKQLRPSPENSFIYRPRSTGDADFQRLAESIRDHGVQSPLLVSRDGFIISGHQRHTAALEVGRVDVPIIVLGKRRSDHSPDEWVAILREHNTGRQKTLNELIREKLIDVAVVETAGEVVDSLVATSDVTSPTIDIPATRKTRSRITSMTRDFADAILHILNEGDLKGLNVNERAIHYRLLPPLNVRTSTRSDGFIYGEPGKDSVGALSRMLTRLRLTGEVPWHRIVDETRPVVYWKTYANAAEFIEAEVRDLFVGYARDLMQSQDNHYVIVAEKLTVKSFVDRVAAKYTIPTVILRGNSGIDARYQLAKRFKASGKRNLVLFILSDCDPAGDVIAETTCHSLRDEFSIPDVQAIRVAFTHAQADEHGLSANAGLVCNDSSVTPKFIKRHGRNDCYELEAVSPQILQSMLDEAIRANINVDLYNDEVVLQDEDNAAIHVRRQIAREGMAEDTEDTELVLSNLDEADSELDLSNLDTEEGDE